MGTLIILLITIFQPINFKSPAKALIKLILLYNIKITLMGILQFGPFGVKMGQFWDPNNMYL
jgi:hypothetical protein